MCDKKLFKEILYITRNWGINLPFYHKQVASKIHSTFTCNLQDLQPGGEGKNFCPALCLVNKVWYDIIHVACMKHKVKIANPKFFEKVALPRSSLSLM